MLVVSLLPNHFVFLNFSQAPEKHNREFDTTGKFFIVPTSRLAHSTFVNTSQPLTGFDMFIYKILYLYINHLENCARYYHRALEGGWLKLDPRLVVAFFASKLITDVGGKLLWVIIVNKPRTTRKEQIMLQV